MRNGLLRDLVDVLRPVRSRQADGQYKITGYETLYTSCPARIEELIGVESEVSGREEARMTHRVVMHWEPGIQEDCRIVVDGNRILEIRAIANPDSRSQVLIITCIELRV